MHRYDGRLIWLTYHGESVVKSLYLVKVRKGSPTTLVGDYIKDGGVMAGMSRDKCGAAGLMETISVVQPAGVKVVVALSMVRNCVGANCYVKDEIITSRARVGNTGAEGRMAFGAGVLGGEDDGQLEELRSVHVRGGRSR